MIHRVLVTRPEPGASDTAERLAELGFEPDVLPLSETVSLAVTGFAGAGEVDLVAVTSANAMRHAPPDLINALASKQCFAVGERTADACRQSGFLRVVSADGDAAGLAEMIIDRSSEGTRIGYLCGKVRRPDFEAELARNRRLVIPIETYDTKPLMPSAMEVQQAVGGASVDAVLVYSAETARQLSRLLEQPPIAKLLKDAVFCCLSQRIALDLAVDPARIRVAPRPEQEALFGVLQRGG